MSNKVMPAAQQGEGVLSLRDMDPDFNSDGLVDETEALVYRKLQAADADGDGFLTRKEVSTLLAASVKEIQEAQSGGIPISTLNPDTDGDGKVEKWEVDVYNRIKNADSDKSGAISVKELFGVIKGAAESDRQKKLFRRLFFVALLVILGLIGAMLGMGIVAGEAVKENHVSSAGTLTTLDGSRNVMTEEVPFSHAQAVPSPSATTHISCHC